MLSYNRFNNPATHMQHVGKIIRIKMWPVKSCNINNKFGQLVPQEMWRTKVIFHKIVVKGGLQLQPMFPFQAGPLSVYHRLKQKFHITSI